MHEEVSAAPATYSWSLWLWWSFLAVLFAAEVGRMSGDVVLTATVLATGLAVIVWLAFSHELIASANITQLTARTISLLASVVVLGLVASSLYLLRQQLGVVQLSLMLMALVVVTRPDITRRVIRRIRTNT